MTQIVDTQTGIPVLITTKSELGSRSGSLLRAVSTGAVVRIDDHTIGCEAALMVGPALIPAVLAFIGVDPGTMPEPGTVRDAPEPVPADREA